MRAEGAAKEGSAASDRRITEANERHEDLAKETGAGTVAPL
jgi:hypothetical protein